MSFEGPGLTRVQAQSSYPYSAECVEGQFSEVRCSNLQSLQSKDSTSPATFGIRGSPVGEHRPLCGVDS